jgi:hypothetical protein
MIVVRYFVNTAPDFWANSDQIVKQYFIAKNGLAYERMGKLSPKFLSH